MLLDGYLFYLKARNLSPRTIKATREYLSPFVRLHDPLSASRSDIEGYLADMFDRCKPATVWTAWRHLKGLFGWLHDERDIEDNPMERIPRPIVPPVEIRVLRPAAVRALPDASTGRTATDRRDRAIIALMLDTGMRLSEVVGLTMADIGTDRTLRVFGKGRKWRSVALGDLSSQALGRWLRTRGGHDGPLWTGTSGPLGPTGTRKMIQRRARQADLNIHPHVLRHTFVDRWLRNGGSEVDPARPAGWTTTRMAERYAQQRANERAVTSHNVVKPLDRIIGS
jgi:site-specific recombinase XerD